MLQSLGKTHGILINHNHVLIHFQEEEMLQYYNQYLGGQGNKLVRKKIALEILVPILKGK